ncbi:MAG: MFS transporter [Thermoprotei archaeon]
MTVYGLSRAQWSQIFAAWGGWLMDGYTSIAYALVGLAIAPIFFPASLQLGGIVATFAGFAVGALARSVGSLTLGNFLGDKVGRKSMLVLTVLFFSVFSALKALLPGYNQVGIISPILLYALLFLEGFFGGAEYGGGTTLAMESVPAEKRSFIGAFVQSGFGCGYFIVAFVYAGLRAYFGDSFAAVGWRVLFATALVPGVITVLLRAVSKETPVFEEMKARGEVERVPVKELFKQAPKPMLLAILVTTGLLFVNTATFSFYPSFMTIKGFSGVRIGEGVAIINLVSLFGVWLGGALGNTINGRRRPMLIYAIIFLLSVYPILRVGYYGGYTVAVTVFSMQAFVEAMIFSTLPAFLAELFSKKFRTTGVGFTYNAGAIVGGFAISIIFALSPATGLFASWLTLIIIFSLIIVTGIALSKETWTSVDSAKAKDRITE